MMAHLQPHILYMFFQHFILQKNRRNNLYLKIMRRRRKMWNMIRQVHRIQRIMFMEYMKMLPVSNILEMYLSNIHVERSLWMKPRSNYFWSKIVLCTYTDSDWIETFRMCKRTFNDLCFLLQPALEPKPLFLKPREPLSVDKQVAVALYKMAHCAQYRIVGNVFGIHKSTVKKCLYRVVSAINDLMMKDYLQMPNVYEASEIAMNFERISHIPQIIGCIDSSHIPILAPSESYSDFVNRKGWPSYVLQAVVDDKYRFRNICIRPGSIHDAAVFKDSSLYKNVQNIVPRTTKNINGLEIPYLIVGDPAYPLLPWLLKGYPNAVTAEQESFNVHLNFARDVVEIAFGRLKARWKILLKRIDINHIFVPHITSSCCILQNFLECKKEQFIQQWLNNDVAEVEKIYPQPIDVINRECDISGLTIRQHLTDYLCNNYPLRASI